MLARRRWILSGIAGLAASFGAMASLLGGRGASLVDDGSHPLRFTAEAANSTIALIRYHTSAPTISDLQYSVNGDPTWQTLGYRTVVTLPNVGDYVEIRKTSRTIQALATSALYSNRFSMTGRISADGNLYSLLTSDYENLQDLSGAPNYLLCSLFTDCTALTTPPKLPARTLSYGCYYSLFQGCTSLTRAPELPADKLEVYCYYSMFRDCTSLTMVQEQLRGAPKEYSHGRMFQGCTSLTRAPDLLSTSTAASYCYYCMFQDCTSLVKAPELRSTLLYYRSYGYMFAGCSSLREIKYYYGYSFSEDDLYHWVDGVAPSGTFYYNGDASYIKYGVSAVPEGWTVQPF